MEGYKGRHRNRKGPAAAGLLRLRYRMEKTIPGTGEASVPQTGDGGNSSRVFLTLLASGGLMGFVLFFRKRKAKETGF